MPTYSLLLHPPRPPALTPLLCLIAGAGELVCSTADKYGHGRCIGTETSCAFLRTYPRVGALPIVYYYLAYLKSANLSAYFSAPLVAPVVA